MADTRTWEGVTSGDWDTATNWSDDTKPVNGDSVIFNGGFDVAVTGDLDQSALTLVDVFIGDDYTKDLGNSAGDPLILGPTTKVIHRGKGTLFLDQGNDITEIVIAHTGVLSTLAASLANTTGATLTRATISRGRVSLISSVSLPTQNLIVAGDEVDLTVGGASVAIVDFHQWGGLVTVDVAATQIISAYVAGGLFVVTDIVDLTTLNMSGGTVQYNDSAVMTTANLYGGLLDLTQTRVEKTVTTVNLWPTAKFRYFPDLMTADPTINKFDGKDTIIGR